MHCNIPQSTFAYWIIQNSNQRLQRLDEILQNEVGIHQVLFKD